MLNTYEYLRRGDESQPPALLSLFKVELGSMFSDMCNPCFPPVWSLSSSNVPHRTWPPR